MSTWLTQEILDWLSSPSLLEKNEISRLHKLMGQASRVRILNRERPWMCDAKEILTGAHPFVVKHDWASVFTGNETINFSEVRLPFEKCVFEFRMSGRNVMLAATQDGDELVVQLFFDDAAGNWYTVEGESVFEQPLGRVCVNQVCSIMAMLDAEVACEKLIRAPLALNQKRARSGKTLLHDYHVVDLSRRHRIDRPGTDGEHNKVRLHFRRGHWRNFSAHKTWVRWCLVGNPDLGFVDKHYAL